MSRRFDILAFGAHADDVEVAMGGIIANFRDRLIRDTVEARLAVARLIRVHRPRYVFTTKGSGVHPDHRAVTEIVVDPTAFAKAPVG